MILNYYEGMQEEIVAQGLELMLYGMGTVVVFLALLVVATGAMSRTVNRYFPEEPEVLAEPVPARQPVPTAATDAELVAVISAAVQQHRKRR
ncbi:MAG: OadG family protein [Halioglobus sp.]